MRMRRLAAAFGLAALATTTIAAGPTEAPLGELTEDGLLVVGEDPTGDWGSGSDAAIGSAAGQDLTGAYLGLTPDTEELTVRFVIGLQELPANGGMPEVTRYSWNFVVDDELELELDGKWTNASRGICDPTAGSCGNVPQPQEFKIRGNCAPDPSIPAINFTACEEFASVIAAFDPATGRITIDVPAELIEVSACSTIGPGPGTFGGSLSAAPAAFLTSSAMPMDTMFIDEIYRLPSADGSECPPLPED